MGYGSVRDTSTRQRVIVYILDRKSNSLLDAIIKFVKPWIVIWINCWPEYKSMSTLENVPQYLHKTVNYTQNFNEHINRYMNKHGKRIRSYC